MIPVSVVIMTKNEERRLPSCIESLAGQFSEVFVVDSNSDDQTKAIAERMGAKVVNFTWNRQYPKKKQWCLKNLPFQNDWTLYLDADERVTPEFMRELRELMQRDLSGYGAFWISFDPIWQGKRLRHGQCNHKICLKHKNRARFPVIDDLDTPKNEVEGQYQPGIDGQIGEIKSRMTHDCDPIPAWYRRHINYAEVAAMMQDRVLNKHETGWRAMCKQILKRLPLQGLLVFLYGYIWRLGFLDGREGFDYAAARGWYYELSALFRRKVS